MNELTHSFNHLSSRPASTYYPCSSSLNPSYPSKVPNIVTHLTSKNIRAPTSNSYLFSHALKIPSRLPIISDTTPHIFCQVHTVLVSSRACRTHKAVTPAIYPPNSTRQAMPRATTPTQKPPPSHHPLNPSSHDSSLSPNTPSPRKPYLLSQPASKPQYIILSLSLARLGSFPTTYKVKIIMDIILCKPLFFL
jgi:hypothetical protein